MSILFKPTGQLDISTDPSELPETGDGVNLASGAMTRCKNLRIDQAGKAVTRDGSQILNDNNVVDGSIDYITEQNGHRYIFTMTGQIYRDEVVVTAGSVCEAPSFDPSAGAYSDAQSVTITSTTGGSSIYYTLNGSIPTRYSGILYTGPVTVEIFQTLKAIAVKAGFEDSPVTTGYYYTANADMVTETDSNTITTETDSDQFITEEA